MEVSSGSSRHAKTEFAIEQTGGDEVGGNTNDTNSSDVIRFQLEFLVCERQTNARLEGRSGELALDLK